MCVFGLAYHEGDNRRGNRQDQDRIAQYHAAIHLVFPAPECVGNSYIDEFLMRRRTWPFRNYLTTRE